MKPLSAITIEQAERPEYWNDLCPELSIEGGGPPPTCHLPNLDELLENVRTEGYVNQPGVVPIEYVQRIRQAMFNLHQAGIPPAFGFVFDEFWLMFAGLRPFLSALLGEEYRAIPAFWAWHVAPSDESKGWKAHRDRGPATLGPDRRPYSFSVWLPVTDASPLNGCMYVLPQHLDPKLAPFKEGMGERPFQPPLQNVRALPAPAGSLLGWHQMLLHWGSRASRLGKEPRCSMSVEFQRGDRAPFEGPLLDPLRPPSFGDRLGMIGRLTRSYAHMTGGVSPTIASVAYGLEARYGAAVPA